MKKTTILNVPKDIQYLSQVIKELPTNCIFDKGKVGAGGTTIALKSTNNFVLAVPFKNLIVNKVNQFPNGEILGVDGNTTKKEIIEYINSHEIKKIMVTYDSLEKLTNWINPKEYRLLIDEYHLLFQQYSFRRDAAQSVLTNYIKYDSFCFMTATLLEDDFILDELMDIPLVKAEWETVREVKVQAIKCKNNVSSTTAQIIKDFLNNQFEGNCYLFVNSVEFIKEMIEECGLDNNNCRAVWSNNNKTQLSIERGSVLDEPKKINMFTSTVFEGCDVYDENGHIFVISDNRKNHTLIDISTSLQQIAGRIRNTKYWGTIYHIYTHTRYDVGVTYEEFKESCNNQINITKSSIDKFNGLFTSEEREVFTKNFNGDSSYFTKEGNSLIFDANKVKLDLYNFKITKCIYRLRVNMKDEYVKAGFEVNEFTNNALPIKRMETLELSFAELVKSMEKRKFELGYYDIIYKRYPFLEEAVNKLGFERMKELRYVIKSIKKELVFLKGDSIINKTFYLLKNNSKIVTGNFISSADCKKIFKDMYAELGIKKTAKSTDIMEYYEVKESTKKINGKSVRGYTIIRTKLMIK